MLDFTIKHISFDAWNTVLIPNQTYAVKRSQLIADLYEVPLAEARRIYTETKRHFDNLAETSGAGFPVLHVCETLDSKLSRQVSSERVEVLRVKLEQLFSENPPLVLPELIIELRRLVETGRTVGILSNTNFIAGRVLREVIFERMDVHFTTSLFSDEQGISKPHPEFFAKMVQEAGIGNGQVKSSANILHVGDMLSTDGAAPAPMQNFIIKDPHDLVRMLKEKNCAK